MFTILWFRPEKNRPRDTHAAVCTWLTTRAYQYHHQQHRVHGHFKLHHHHSSTTHHRHSGGGGAYEARRLVPPRILAPGGTLWSVPRQNFCRQSNVVRP